jgi:hypothetical protein
MIQVPLQVAGLTEGWQMDFFPTRLSFNKSSHMIRPPLNPQPDDFRQNFQRCGMREVLGMHALSCNSVFSIARSSSDEMISSRPALPCYHKFSFCLIPGGNLIPPPPATPLLPSSAALPSPSALFTTASTLPFCRLKAGHTQTPQLHLMPCHA